MRRTDPIDPEEILAQAGWVRRLARGIVVDDAAADDVVQQTVVAAWERPPRAGTPLRPWLARVARNFALRMRRGDTRRSARESATSGGVRPQSSPEDLAIRAEAFRRVTAAVLELEPAHRDVVLLRYFDGLETGEIAARLDVPVETVRTRLKRAHAVLRARLDREHGDRRAWLVLIGATDAPPPGRAVPPSVLTAVVTGGLLVGKKTLFAAAVVLLAALGTWATWRAVGSRGATPPDPPVMAAAARPQARAARTGTPGPATATAPVAKQPAGPCVRGRVVGPDGTPVPDATIVASPMPAWSGFVGDVAATSARGDATGAFVLPVDPAVPTMRLVAEARGYAPAMADSVRAGDDVVVRLRVAASISGTVFDSEGKRVAGARVAWIAPLAGRAALVRRAVSGADGHYRIDDLPPHRGGFPTDGANSTTITAEADGYARVFVRANSAQAPWPETVDVYLVRGAVVEGVVVEGETGAPLPHVAVTLRGLGYPEVPGGASGLVVDTSQAVLAATASDAEGRFRFDHAPANGVHVLWANANGTRGPLVGDVRAEAPGFVPARDEVPAAADGTRISARLEMWPVATIAGRVTDPAGAPMPGLEVFAFARPKGPGGADARVVLSAPTFTDADGRYRIDGVLSRRDGPASVTVHVLSGARRGSTGQEQTTADVEVRAGATSEARDVVVGSGDVPVVVFRVTDDAGRPVHGATVSRTQWVTEAVTDRDGRARVACGPAHSHPAPCRFVVRAAGRAPVASEFVTPDAGVPPEVRVTLAQAHRIAGRVVHPDGSPATGVQVTAATADVAPEVVFPREGLPLGAGSPLDPALPGLVLFGQATTAADGSFAIDDVPAGACRLQALRFGSAATIAGPFAADSADVVVPVPPPPAPRPGVPVEIVVTDAETGVPLTQCVVSVGASDGLETFLNGGGGLPGRWGAYVCPSVAEGECVVRVRSRTHLDLDVPIVVRAGGSNRVEVRLSRGATIRGTLRVPEGVRPDDVAVWVASEDRAGEFRGTGERAAADGSFAVRAVPPGRWRVGAYFADATKGCVAATPNAVEVAEGAREVRTDVLVVAAGTLQVAWPGTDRPSPRVTVRDASGRTVWDADAPRGMTETSVLLPPGTYEVEIRWERERIAPFRADVTAGAVTRAGPAPR
jgi:RNA polymerase sigma-70 factor (ECF subfamily)